MRTRVLPVITCGLAKGLTDNGQPDALTTCMGLRHGRQSMLESHGFRLIPVVLGKAAPRGGVEGSTCFPHGKLRATVPTAPSIPIFPNPVLRWRPHPPKVGKARLARN